MTNTGPFEEENLTVRDHNDPAKHYIGEALTPPSLGDITFAGVETSTGTSPFPARADHSHDARARFSGFNVSGKVISASGSDYIDGWVNSWNTEDFLHSGSDQLFDFPQEGAYQITMNYHIARASGNFPSATRYQIRLDFFNATVNVSRKLQTVPEGGISHSDSLVSFHYFPEIDATTNLQILVVNNDTEDWEFDANLEIWRKHSALGATEIST